MEDFTAMFDHDGMREAEGRKEGGREGRREGSSRIQSVEERGSSTGSAYLGEGGGQIWPLVGRADAVHHADELSLGGDGGGGGGVDDKAHGRRGRTDGQRNGLLFVVGLAKIRSRAREDQVRDAFIDS